MSILVILVDLHVNGAKGIEYVGFLENTINYLATQQPAPAEPMASPPSPPARPHTATADEHLHGQTLERIELTFEQIATMANTLRNFLTQEATQADTYIANIVVCQIGSLVDCMTGSGIVGNPAA